MAKNRNRADAVSYTHLDVYKRQVAASSDLKAGQLIDRTGVRLGLQFPCGPALEQLALQSLSLIHI